LTEPTLVTIQPVQEVPDKVAVRPYVDGARCLCHLTILIPKDTIESVTAKGLYSQCCGKRLAVVEIHFKSDSTMLLTDLFGQLSFSLAASTSDS
jgi:hypothetical protein